MATTVTAPPQSSVSRWVLVAVAAVGAVAILVGLLVSLGSDPSAPTTGVTPDRGASTEHVTPAEARRNAINERSAQSGESRVPARAF